MDRRIKGISTFLIIVLLTFAFCIVMAEEGEFEDLGWELAFPEEILTDASAQVDISAGFFFSDKPAIGGFCSLEPKMHFLIFDGEFNVTLEQREDDFGPFIQLANDEVSDYFTYTRVKYKNLIFSFGAKDRMNSQLIFLPREDFNRKYVSFKYDNSGWNAVVKSPEWKSWAFGGYTPELSLGEVGFSLKADAFLDNSSSPTYAISVGPALNYRGLSLSPFLAYENVGIAPGLENEYDPLFKDNAQTVSYGVLGKFEKDIFALKAGIKTSFALSPFISVILGPLELSAGKNVFLSHEARGTTSWVDVYWNYETDRIKSSLGFSNEKDYKQTVKTSIFSDFEFKLLDDLFLDIRLMKREEWIFRLGARYSFNVDFYQ